VEKANWIKKWGAIIGLIGGLIGAVGGGFTIYDRWGQPELDIIGFAPVAVWTKPKGVEAVRQGISSIIRVQNKGNKPAYVMGADIHGKVYLSFDEYWPICRQRGDTRPSEDIKSEFMGIKPYMRISWVGWISDQKGPLKVEPAEERFLKITFAEPILSWGVSQYSRRQSDYISYDGKGKPSKYVNHHPAIQWFFKIIFKGKHHNLQDIRDEVKNGLIKIEVRFGTKSKNVDRDKIIDLKYITKEAWDDYPARKIYFDIY